MSWNKYNIHTFGKIGLLLAILFVFLSSRFVEKSNIIPQILLVLAGAGLSVWITLEFVERVIEEDRKRQWEKIKSLTYTTILIHICQLAHEAPFYVPNDLLITEKYMLVINKNVRDPKKEVAIAIVELAFALNKINNSRVSSLEKFREEDIDLWNLEMRNEALSLNLYYQEIQCVLEEIRSILIPRVLQLSSNQEVNEALIKFEDSIRLFENIMIHQQQHVKNEIPTARRSIVPFLIEAGILYEILQYELKNSRRTIKR